MNAKDLSQRMAADAEGIAAYLLPGGKRKGREFKAGNTDGEEGESLSVCVTGHKAGVWKDFAADVGGDLLDLWMRCRGCDLPEAMDQVKAHLGIRDDMPGNQPPAKTYRRPEKPKGKGAVAQNSTGAVAEWLRSRGLTDATIEAFKIVEQPRGGKVYALFPYLSETGEYLNGKARNIADKKDMLQESGAMPCLFGWHLVDPRQRTIAIAEGEIDAMTLHQVGIPALSVNAGAGNHQWIESDWERLERFSDILVFFDCDEAGEKGAREVINRLGPDRCRRVKFNTKAKDANEFLLAGADRYEFDAMVQDAQPVDPEELRSMADFINDVQADFYPTHDGPRFPVLRLDKDLPWFEFRGGEVTLWTGINGHGKSLVLSQISLGLMQQGEVFTIFSGEMTPARQLKRMVKQATGLDRPTREYIAAVGEWLRERCWVFNHLGQAPLDRLLTVFAYAHRRYGATHFVIDSLMTTDVPDDGQKANTLQKEAMAKIAGFAQQFNVHVHLVAHPRKGRDESSAPGKMDVAGSGHLTNRADNIFAMWKASKDESQPDDTGEKDALLDLMKQRNENTQKFTLALWFNKGAQQYRSSPRWVPLSYVSYSNQDEV